MCSTVDKQEELGILIQVTVFVGRGINLSFVYLIGLWSAEVFPTALR